MKFIFTDLVEQPLPQGAESTAKLAEVFAVNLSVLEPSFVQDLSHISTAANYAGGMTIDGVTYLKDNLYRCDYSYDWDIAWTCSGTQEAGRVSEKVRFTLEADGIVNFQFLQLG